MKRNLALNLITAVFIFLFTYTAFSKLLSFQSFQYTLSRLPLIGSFSTVLAVVLPLFELAIAAMLFLPSAKRAGIWASLLIMLLFTSYITYAILLDMKLPCSCGGVFQALSWIQHLWVNFFLTLLAFIAVRIQMKAPRTGTNFSLQ